MALILSLETSATECSVALHDTGKLLKTFEINEGQAHASQLAILINNIFQKTHLPFSDLRAVAVSGGPGSYTGLRIGVSTAKGICYALNIPLISIPTLDLLTFQFRQNNAPLSGLLCPMIDAKRMEVYYHIVDLNLSVRSAVEAKNIDEKSFGELLKDHQMFFFGDGAEKCKNVINSKNAFFADGIRPKATQLGFMAYAKFEKKIFEDLATFTPFYLKDFIAKKAKPVF
jgi:tRNA threonylcarbamoyladenosine biosynthesis protein TsaB